MAWHRDKKFTNRFKRHWFDVGVARCGRNPICRRTVECAWRKAGGYFPPAEARNRIGSISVAKDAGVPKDQLHAAVIMAAIRLGDLLGYSLRRFAYFLGGFCFVPMSQQRRDGIFETVQRLIQLFACLVHVDRLHVFA